MSCVDLKRIGRFRVTSRRRLGVVTEQLDESGEIRKGKVDSAHGNGFLVHDVYERVSNMGTQHEADRCSNRCDGRQDWRD